MVWSFSSSRSFQKCQRQWYIKNFIANAKAKDQIRHEAYLLSKFQSLYAWRGTIVDQVISNSIIPAINSKHQLSPNQIIQIAKKLYDEQLEFARLNRIREPGMTISKAGESFAALYPIEYDGQVADDELLQAWQDIENALECFLHMDELNETLNSARYLLPQRALSFTYDSISARTVPDLIVFFSNKPPMIVDWKVHTYAIQNYRLQLACYAIGLTTCKPHRDFPVLTNRYLPNEIKLLEVQLLTRQLRHYELTESDVEAVLSYIVMSAREMDLATTPFDGQVLTLVDFSTTANPEECQRCSFRSLCWENSNYVKT
ncbi:MAG: PD-(D/E)XK nuclease family protein [Bellilinea sp.]|jgi:hypothetical protein